MGGVTMPTQPRLLYHFPMPSRLKRCHSEGHEHFLTFSCYQRAPLLDNDTARIHFEETLERVRKDHDFAVFGYVLMPEHVHMLVSEPKNYTLATSLSVLKRLTGQALRGDGKQFWQTRYYDFNVFTTKKHVEKLRYIHRNPVKRGLVELPEQWPWSSYRHYLTGEPGRVEIASGWPTIPPTAKILSSPLKP